VAVRTGNTGFFSNGKSDVLVYGMDGEEITNFTIEDRVKSLRISDDIIAINSAKMLYIEMSIVLKLKLSILSFLIKKKF